MTEHVLSKPAPTWIQRLTTITLFVVMVLGLTVILNQFVTSKLPFGVDFYVYWLNAHRLFVEGESPFTAEAALQAQVDLYGRVATDQEDKKGFVYLPYSLFLIAPTVWFSFSQALAFWLAFNLLLVIAVARLAFPQLPLWITATLPFFYPLARGMIMGQFSVLLGTLLILVYGLGCTRPKPTKLNQWAIGFLLAILTIKPPLTWLLIIYFLFEALKTKKYSVQLSFAVSLGLLSLISWFFIPAWPMQLINQIIHGSDEYQAPRILPQIYASWVVSDGAINSWATILTILLGLTTLIMFIYSWYKRLPSFTLLAWCALMTQLVHPLNVPSEQVVLLLPILAGLGLGLNKHIVWGIALLFPYVLFIIAAEPNLEPLALTTLPPLLFAGWLVWLPLQFQENLTQNSQIS